MGQQIYPADEKNGEQRVLGDYPERNSGAGYEKEQPVKPRTPSLALKPGQDADHCRSYSTCAQDPGASSPTISNLRAVTRRHNHSPNQPREKMRAHTATEYAADVGKNADDINQRTKCSQSLLE